MAEICKDCEKPKDRICACGKPIKGKMYIIKNKINGNMLGVGDCCISHFRD